MKTRKYKTADCVALADLFYGTVHTINAKDYTKFQLVVRGGIELANFTIEKCITK